MQPEGERMLTPYSLERIITAVTPRLNPTTLICRDNLNVILGIASFMPHWQCTGFECRLGNPEPYVDFGVNLRREDCMATNWTVIANAKTIDAGSREVWRRLHGFAHVWAQTQSLLSQAISAISLEFDVRRPQAALVAPSVFFSIHPGPCGPEVSAGCNGVDTCSKVVRALLEVLVEHVSDGVLNKLEECFKVLLQKVPFLQFGVWLARPTDNFRICAPGIPLVELRRIVHALQWEGPANAYESHWCELLEFGEKGCLHLDIGKVVSAKLGIEVPFDDSSVCMKREDRESTRLFDYLVQKKLCLPEKRDAVLSWVGGFRLSINGTASCGEETPIFLRRVSHVKIIYEPDEAPTAKAYLTVGRAWSSLAASGATTKRGG
jgi:hypothetical protein